MRNGIVAAILSFGGSLGAQDVLFQVALDAEGLRRAESRAFGEARERPLDATDRAENGGFDADQTLRAWSTYVAPPYGVGSGTALWSPEDAGGERDSGSLLLTNTSPAGGPREYGVQQCLRPARPLTGLGRPFRTRFSVRVPPGQEVGDDTYLAAAVILFTSENCTTGFLGGGGIATPLTALGTSGWQLINPAWEGGTEFFVPAGSALFVLSLHKQAGLAEPVQVSLDDVGVRGSWQPTKGDLNRDGETDLILHDTTTGANVAWFMRDELRLGPAVPIEPAPKSLDWQVAGVDDFDGDGEQDLLMWNDVSGETEFWLMNGTTRIGPAVPLQHALPPPWLPAATADFDGDGQPDLLYRNADRRKHAVQKLVVWVLNGTSHVGTIEPSPDHATHFNWDLVAARDLDGDGHTDLLWFNRNSGRLVYWLLDASVKRLTGGFTNPAQADGPSWKLVAAGDYGLGPAPGRPSEADSIDLVWRNLQSGQLALWFMGRLGNRTGGQLVWPAPPAPANLWTVAGPK